MERHHMLPHRESLTDRDNKTTTNDPGPPPALPSIHSFTRPMPLNPPFQPPAYSQPTSAIHFPDVPTTELPLPRPRPAAHHDNDTTLPAFSTISKPQSPRQDLANYSYNNPSRTAYRPLAQPLMHNADSPGSMDIDNASTGTLSAASPDRAYDARASSVSTLSLDDPEVRLVAEALGDLRADYVSSPTNSNITLPPIASSAHDQRITPTMSPAAPEPLLQLLTIDHPFLARTIENASSAYGGAKELSPRFKSSAEYVEGYLTPIANTVGSVGRVTGVEGGIRWYLGSGRRHNSSSSDIAVSNNSNKRRKMHSSPESHARKRFELDPSAQQAGMGPPVLPELPLAASKDSRRLSMASMDTLPAYDDARSPAYTEVNGTSTEVATQDSAPPAGWQSRIIVSTSGLSVAMSRESLRSLRYCLARLRWANGHIGRLADALRKYLERWDSMNSDQADERMDGADLEKNNQKAPENHDRESIRAQFTQEVGKLKDEIARTLKRVIDTVSQYAGGALPENARVLVARHFTSLPARFRIASMSTDSSRNGAPRDAHSATREGAQKVLVLATEGVEMLSQVSRIVDATIVSAEEWCERLGRKTDGPQSVGEGQSTEKSAGGQLVLGSGDVKVAPVEQEDVKMG